MGNQILILISGTLVLFAIYMIGFRNTNNDLTRNTSESFAEASAKEVNTSAMEMAMSQLADSITWRSSFSNMLLFGGKVTVTFKDTVAGAETCIVVRSRSQYIAAMDTASASSQAIVQPVSSYVPLVVKAALTTFGPVDDLVGDMYIDGRDHNSFNIVAPSKGRFGVSTGQPVFTNHKGAYIGGTYYVHNVGYDLPTTLPEDPRSVETNSTWPNGWPSTPDQALGLPNGTLRSIALSGVGGSRLITSYESWTDTCRTGNEYTGLNWPLSPPLHGVTYFDVPPGAYWEKIAISRQADGILVFHSPGTDAYWKWIAMDGNNMTDSFKGLMVFDRIFHIHINVLGAVVQLNPAAVVEECGENRDHWINYSSETIRSSMKVPATYARGSWKNKLRVLSWLE